VSSITSDVRTTCDGPRIDGRYIVFFEENRLECARGLRVGGHTEIVVRDNSILGNDRVGVEIRGNAVATVSGNIISGNGLSPGSSPAGGVVILDTARADLGGGSVSVGGQVMVSPGNNRIQGNGTLDVRNLTSAPVSARHNCWDQANPADVKVSDTEGAVEVDPLAERPCPDN